MRKLDCMILTILLLIPALVFIWFYFSESKKKDKPKEPAMEEVAPPPDLICSPRITVVFQKDLTDDEELAREIADMYVSNRVYYYSGKSVPSKELLSEKDIYVRYDNINFSSLQIIDI